MMSDFYARWPKDPAAGKAEALRQAQFALLKSQPEAANARNQRGFEAVSENQPAPGQTGAANGSPTWAAAAGYSHPYCWAALVLIGNFK
jgi:CHAT domain-containing protein